MPYPGIDNIKSELNYRSLGRASLNERIGAGFMRKPGVYADNIDLDFPYFVIVYVLRGSGEYVDRTGRRYLLREGSYFKRIPGQKHSNYIDPESDWTEFYLQTGPETASLMRKMRIIPDKLVGHIRVDNVFINKVWDFKEKLKKTDEENVSDALIELLGLINEFFKLETLTDRQKKSVSIIDEACQMLNRDFDRHINLVEFCRVQGWGYEKFRKDFQTRMGISPGHFRIRRRLDVSCQLLNNPDYTISEVAEKLGYSSPYEFSAQFKKFLGISPHYYRNGSVK